MQVTSAGAGGFSSTSVSTGTGTGGGASCGGLLPGPGCTPTEYCDFPANSCGIADESGTCKPRPEACDLSYAPVCGCNGQIYGNECALNGAGQDLGMGCQAPPGFFSCGPRFCHTSTSYCAHTLSDVVGEPDVYLCEALPAGCGANPSCACLSGVSCGQCTVTSDGGLEITCGGG